MGMLNITNGLTRADDDIDLKSFYSLIDGISFLEAEIKNISAMIEAFSKALNDILSALSITGNKDLEDKLFKALTGTMGLSLSLQQANALHTLFALCNMDVDIDLNINLIFKRFVLSFIITGCHPKITFHSSFNAQFEAEINVKIAQIASLEIELGTSINSSISVVNAINGLRSATIALDTNAHANADVGIKGSKDNIARLSTEIGNLQTQRYRANETDEDISVYDNAIKIKEAERDSYTNLLEQQYVNSVDVIIKGLVDDLNEAKKQLEVAKSMATTGDVQQRILFDISKRKAELEHLKDSRLRLFTNIALDTVDNLNKGVQDITVKQLNQFVDSVMSTPVIHSLKRTSFLTKLGSVYDKTVDKQASPSLLSTTKKQKVNKPNTVSYQQTRRQGNKPLYYSGIQSKTDSPISHAELEPFEEYKETVLKLLSIFNISTKEIYKLRESKVLSTGLLHYARDKYLLEYGF